MSTADSVLNVAAVIYSNDIHKRYINKNVTDKKMLQMTKTTTIVIGVIGIIIAIMIPNVINLILYIYTLWAPSMIVPLVACIVTSKDGERKVSPYAAVPSILVGIITFVIFNHFIAEPPLPPVFVGMLFNLIVFVIISYVTGKKKPLGWFLPNDLEIEKEV